jgi:squalene-hopene/tetraprenyl-beta-curcumene cyclase
MNQGFVRKAADWLKSRQNPDGGWGETCETYEKPELRGRGNSAASQTAWGVMALLACGEANGDAVRRGIDHLIGRQLETGGWWEPEFTGTGFPVHFFIKYHMYQHYFPLMALARYRSAVRDGIDEPRKARKR